MSNLPLLGWLPIDESLLTLISSESLLRRALFEDTGGMYPELITRSDVKVFLPPIGGLTVYICTISIFLLLKTFFFDIHCFSQKLEILLSCLTRVKS